MLEHKRHLYSGFTVGLGSFIVELPYTTLCSLQNRHKADTPILCNFMLVRKLSKFLFCTVPKGTKRWD